MEAEGLASATPITTLGSGAFGGGRRLLSSERMSGESLSHLLGGHPFFVLLDRFDRFHFLGFAFGSSHSFVIPWNGYCLLNGHLFC